MMNFVNLVKTAVECYPPVLEWFRALTKKDDIVPLTPKGWFEEEHGIVGGSLDRQGVWVPTYGPTNELFLWNPSLVVADTVLEEL